MVPANSTTDQNTWKILRGIINIQKICNIPRTIFRADELRVRKLCVGHRWSRSAALITDMSTFFQSTAIDRFNDSKASSQNLSLGLVLSALPDFQ